MFVAKGWEATAWRRCASLRLGGWKRPAVAQCTRACLGTNASRVWHQWSVSVHVVVLDLRAANPSGVPRRLEDLRFVSTELEDGPESLSMRHALLEVCTGAGPNASSGLLHAVGRWVGCPNASSGQLHAVGRWVGCPIASSGLLHAVGRWSGGCRVPTGLLRWSGGCYASSGWCMLRWSSWSRTPSMPHSFRWWCTGQRPGRAGGGLDRTEGHGASHRRGQCRGRAHSSYGRGTLRFVVRATAGSLLLPPPPSPPPTP
jgi:hypothetical protein